MNVSKERNVFTFPEDLIPLNIPIRTITQATSNESVILQTTEPGSSIDGEIFMASRYQKYDVGLVMRHSSTSTVQEFLDVQLTGHDVRLPIKDVCGRSSRSY